MSGRGTDFFVSHAGRDTGWAEWLAWQLEQAGYRVELDVWDWAPGEDFVTHMQAALQRADRLLAVCTQAYFASAFGGAELRAAFAGSASAPGRIVPVLVEPVVVPSLFAPLIPVDLAGLDEAAAAARLRDRLTRERPTRPPPYPSPQAAPPDRPGFAGALPAVWKVPPRNPHFTGRDGMLTELRRRLRAGEDILVVQALYGLGGVGKTQLALEYSHRFAVDYQLVWWMDAAQPVLIPEQLAALAARVGLPPGPTVAATVERLIAELRRRAGWLLIFDNAERPADIAGYRPDGPGHVLITSRFPGWGALGGRLEVDVLVRAETIALLRARLPAMSDELADKLAAELGDLPLAAAQAAGYLEQTELPPADYLRRFRTRRATLLSRGEVLGYHGRLDTAWALSLDRLRQQDPAAVQLLQLAAFLAPEPIPLNLFSGHPGRLDEPLRSTAADPDALADTIGALVEYSLARRHPNGFQLHRLVQAVIRHQLSPDQQQATAHRVIELLGAATPGDPEKPTSRAGYAALTPHVLTMAPLVDSSLAGRRLVLSTARYLLAHGDSSGSRVVSEQLLDRWGAILGPDHPDTVTAASILAFARIEVGEAEPARSLAEDTLQRCHRIFGRDHPTTLLTAAALTLALVGLGEAQAARALGEDTLWRCRRALGPEHPITLWVATALVQALLLLGEMKPARELGEDTLQRCHRALGLEHLVTLWVSGTLTIALASANEAERARGLGEDTLQRCHRVLSSDHPVTVVAATAMTVALVGSGDPERARALGEDTLQHSSRVYGLDHLVTLVAATALAVALVGLGDAEAARALGEDTLQRCSRVYGPKHPITLRLTQAVNRLPHVTSGYPMSESEAADGRPSRSP